MKSVHHIIVAAIDAGMSENDAEALAQSLLVQTDPVSYLNQKIADTEDQIRAFTKSRDALCLIRDKYAGNGSKTYANVEDREPERLRG
jgi:hypothetical protein